MRQIHKLEIVSLVLVFLSLFFGGILANTFANAEGNNRNNDDEVSCSYSYTAEDDHTVTVMNGSYTADIATIDFKATCDDEAGFSIYTVGYSNEEYGNNKLVATIDSSLAPEHDIATGVAISGNTSNWAMKAIATAGNYAPTIANNFDTYRTVPNEYTKLASFTEETDDTEGSNIRTNYAIFVSATQPAGTYTGKVKYTLVHPHDETPCVEGKICYHKNANNVVGSMGRQNATGTTTMLMASNFSHEGYGFAGWNTKEDGTGTSYGPNETITLPSDMSEGLNLYAMWVQSAGNLQDWGGCYEMNIGDVTALTDRRDNDTYAIAKLADGKCWMIENLRLDNDATTGSANEALAQGYGTSTTYGNFSGLANPEAPWIGDSTTANSLYSIDGGDGTINIGADNDPARRFPRYNNQNTASRDSYPTTNQNIYSYGNYYTWAAAIADLNPNNTNNQITTGTSLCPTGWHLPSGGAAYASGSATGVNVTGDTDTYRDFYNLSYKIMDEIRTAYEDTAGSDGAYYSDNTTNLAGDTATKAFRKYPNNFVLSGYVYNGSISNRNSYGLYWSSSARNTNYAYRLYMSNSAVYPSTAGGNKFYGRSVRCVTNSTQRYEVTVNFDSGVESVTLRSAEFGTKTVTTSGTVVSLAKDAEYTISGSYVNERGFDRWTTTSNGALGATDSTETSYVLSGDATLTLSSKRACVGGYICYDKNYEGTSAAGGGMKNQEVDGDDDILWNSNFYRDGYGFAGWNTEPDGSGTMYGPTETIHYGNNASAIAESGLMLYAVWVQSTGYLQDFTCPSNTRMPIGTVTALTDMRDNQVYTVAKLADGKCWMTENLRLNSEYTVGNNINDASVTNEELAQGYGKTDNFGNFIGLADSEGGTFKNRTTANSLYSTDGSTTVNIGSSNSASNRMPRYNNYNLSNPGFNMDGFLKTTIAYRNGNFYTGSAATASTDYYDTIDQNIATSICPTGWRLPTSGRITHAQDGEFYVLAKLLMNGTEPNRVADGADYAGYEGTVGDVDMGVLASERLRTYPTNFTLAGDIGGDEQNPSNQGEYGAYWSSTVGLNDLMQIFTLEVYQNSVYPSKTIQTYLGQSVRCVSEFTGVEGYDYMQDFAGLTSSELETVKSSMEEGKQYTIKDNRDDKFYYISKLADGNIWMTQNLDFDIVDGGADINSSNTNVPDDWNDAGNLEDTRASDDMSWDGSMMTPKSYDAGDLCWRGSISIDNHNDSEPCADSLQDQANHTHVGNYYNWTAAVAMSDSSSYVAEGTDVNQSICPAGWTLPKGGTEPKTNSFANLINQQNLTSGESGNAHQAPTYFAYGGAWEGYNLDSLGLGGVAMYQTSTVISDRTAFRLFLSASNTSAPEIDGFYKGTAYSIRCMVAESLDISDLGYMQDFADLTADEKTKVLDSMVQDHQYQLVDERDDKVYYVSKLADGNVWMTQNLDYDIVNGGADINSTNTDVPANWTGAGHLNDTYTPEYDSWYNLGRYSESYDVGDWCWDGSIEFNDDAEWYKYSIPCTDRHYHVGNYYNWTAAVALEDSYMYYAPEESTGYDNVDVDQSICPAGWMLPKDGISSGSGTYEYLVNQQHLAGGVSGNIHQAPAYFVYGGWYYGGIPDYFGGEGFYLSSVFLPDQYNTMGYMSFDEYDEDPIVYNGGRSNDDGYSLRCLVRK